MERKLPEGFKMLFTLEADPPASYKVYRHHRDKYEDYWEGNIFLDKTLVVHGDEAPPPPPYIVVVQGPPNVGKSLLIKSLAMYFTNREDYVPGPITILTGDGRRRLHFVECPDDINAMIDASKYADLVLFVVDASYGFEAETFEFLNLLQAHGFPKVMGVLTHLDKFKDEAELKETKKRLVEHFGTEICQGATISCISGLDRELYKMGDVRKLAENILMLQPCSSSWRAANPYVLVDRVEDVTPTKELPKRNIRLYGYLRGCNIKSGAKVHLAGVGDFCLAGVRRTTDPIPLSSDMKKGMDFVEITPTENESFKAGTYLRLEIHDVPSQVVENYDPCYPILIGGISHEEDNVGHMQARHKEHKWHMKRLKSEDPVTVSAGWRRYQTKPIYAYCTGKHDFHQILDFNPDHEYCLAMFWGPWSPPDTRIVVVHGDKEAFRIAAKAVILDHEQPLKIMKEREWEGKTRELVAKNRVIRIPVKEKGEAPKWDEVVAPVCDSSALVCDSSALVWDSSALVNKDLLYKLGRKDLLYQVGRRRVEIIDEEPDSSIYSLLIGAARTMVVISREKRREVIDKRQKEWKEEFKKSQVPPKRLCDMY